MNDNLLIAVIPALDCAATIGPIVEGVLEHVNRVVVVDDGSSDETAAISEKAGAQVEVLEHNRGKGFALRRGIERAFEYEPEAIALLDGDGQHDPSDLPGLISAWRDGLGDLIVGSRLSDRERIPPARYWNNLIGTKILSWMAGANLEDSQSGYRLVSAPLLAAIGLRSDGYAVETEMLLKAARHGATIAHVPIRTIYQDESSHFQPVRDTVRIAFSALRIRFLDPS